MIGYCLYYCLYIGLFARYVHFFPLLTLPPIHPRTKGYPPQPLPRLTGFRNTSYLISILSESVYLRGGRGAGSDIILRNILRKHYVHTARHLADHEYRNQFYYREKITLDILLERSMESYISLRCNKVGVIIFKAFRRGRSTA